VKAPRKTTYRLLPLALFLCLYSVGTYANSSPDFKGLIKLQSSLNGYDSHSAFVFYGDSPQEQYNIDARLMYQQQRESWDWAMHYQIAAQKSKLPDSILGNSAANDTDQYRLWNLSREIKQSDRIFNLQRIDRLFVRYSLDQWVVKLGRQAISWGHGQFFNPLDIANPFDPTLVDKEYKAGDDMAYLQWLQDNGNDVQAALIPRRDTNGQLQSARSTYALKYRGLWQNLDYDILLAKHYDDNVIGFGANIPWRESNINSDWLITQINNRNNSPERNWVVSGNIGISYSWMWWRKNIIGRAELFHNGFGQAPTPTAATLLNGDPALLDRLQRGELYNLAKNYLAAGLNIELHPLFLLDLNSFINLHDPSANLQILGQYNQSDNSNISAGLLLPVGPDASEFGGIASATNSYYSRQYSLFLKYAYYL